MTELPFSSSLLVCGCITVRLATMAPILFKALCGWAVVTFVITCGPSKDPSTPGTKSFAVDQTRPVCRPVYVQDMEASSAEEWLKDMHQPLPVNPPGSQNSRATSESGQLSGFSASAPCFGRKAAQFRAPPLPSLVSHCAQFLVPPSLMQSFQKIRSPAVWFAQYPGGL